MTSKYREEKARYNFKESCEDCRYYCEKTDRCAMLYPMKPHRKKTILETKDGERVYFCKMFEV